jgi:hypothetical protein
MKTAKEFMSEPEISGRLSSIVADSFRTRPMPSGEPTDKEVKDRMTICLTCFVVLLEEAGWTSQRVLDHLPSFLARALDGQEPIPTWARRKMTDSETTMWGADAAGKVESERRLSALAKTGDQALIISPGRKV